MVVAVIVAVVTTTVSAVDIVAARCDRLLIHDTPVKFWTIKV